MGMQGIKAGSAEHVPPIVEIKSPENRKPFAFALAHGEGGASIWHGSLLSCVTLVRVHKDEGKNVISSQDPIPVTEYISPSNLDPDLLLQTHLGWYGDVYGYWEVDEEGDVILFEIRGPDKPVGKDIAELNGDLVRKSPSGGNGGGGGLGSGSGSGEEVAGQYFALIGNVTKGQPVEQFISSDIPWFVTILLEGSSSSTSSSSSSSSSSSGSEDSNGSAGSGLSEGSSKSTCIVPCTKHPEGYTACFIPEMPREGVFFDTLKIRLDKRETKAWVDMWFTEICEQGTYECVGYSCDRAQRLAISISHDGQVTVRRPLFSRASTATILIYAIRKGFLLASNDSPYNMRRMPQRNAEQFHANERFINSAYPSYE